MALISGWKDDNDAVLSVAQMPGNDGDIIAAGVSQEHVNNVHVNRRMLTRLSLDNGSVVWTVRFNDPTDTGYPCESNDESSQCHGAIYWMSAVTTPTIKVS